MGSARYAFVLAACCLTPETARPAAWTLAPGAAFVSVSASRYEPADDTKPTEDELTGYGEIGLRESLTLGASVAAKADSREGFGGISTAWSGAVFLRFRLHEGSAGDPLAFQATVITPLDRPDPATGIFAEERAVDLRLLYGRGYGTSWGDAFVNVEVGTRLLREGGADEFRLDVTAGLRPLPRLLVMAQSFGVLGQRNADRFGSDYDSLKLAPSVGYDLGPATVLLGAEKTAAGRNVDHGLRVKLSLWRSF